MTPRTSAAEVAALRRLAGACGVQTAYTDLSGRRRTAGAEALVAVLAALGEPVRRPADAPAALRRRRETRRLTGPNLVAWAGRLRFSLQVDRRGAAGRVGAALAPECGGPTRALAIEARRVGPADGGRVTLRCRAAERLPEGVHRLEVTAGRRREVVNVIAAPRRCPAPPHAAALGVFLPLYALRSEASWGTGDVGDLQRLAHWAAGLGCRYVGTLPLLASYLDDAPHDPSPYAPVSRLFYNELYADPTSAPELARCPRARALIGSAGFRKRITALHEERLVDYREAMALKRQVLDALARTAFADPAGRARIEARLAAAPELEAYGRFRGVVERCRTTWPDWPARLRDGRLRDGDWDPGARRRHIYAQCLLADQLAAARHRLDADGAALYLDLPVGVHGGGFDVWRHRDQFATAVDAGAPPDPFFSGGQNWGFPPLHPVGSQRCGHDHFRAVLAASLRHAGALRVDHVMALHRMFWIPRGLEPRDGVYVRYPGPELFALLCLEASRAGVCIVGENLGTVPESVNRAMDRRGLLRMWVGQFAFRPHAARAVPAPAPGALACLNTHDMPTFAAFWSGCDLDLRRALGRFLVRRGLLRRPDARPRAVLAALLHLLAASAADVVLVSLEDLWGEREPQNVPGVAEGCPNWRRTAARSLEAICGDARLARTLRALARARAGRRT